MAAEVMTPKPADPGQPAGPPPNPNPVHEPFSGWEIVTRSFRITANGRPAAELAALQLIAASGANRGEAVVQPWARANEGA